MNTVFSLYNVHTSGLGTNVCYLTAHLTSSGQLSLKSRDTELVNRH
jgi:hypothetical protein